MNERLRRLLIPTAAPVPPNLLNAIGYCGENTHVLVHWDDSFDVWHYTDGVVDADLEEEMWSAYLDHPTVAERLRAYHLGSPDRAATHAVLIESEGIEGPDGTLYVLPTEAAAQAVALLDPRSKRSQPQNRQWGEEHAARVEVTVAVLIGYLDFLQAKEQGTN